MPYIGRSLGDGVRARYIYAATSGQTSFSGNDANGIALAYSDTLYMDVYQNGVLLKPVTDYASTTGTSVVLTTGASTDDVLEMIVYDSFAVADTVSAANGGTFSGNMAMGGTLAVTDDANFDSGTLFVDASTNRVGIGTTSPSQLLSIFDSGSARMEIKSGTSGTSIIDMGDTDDADIAGIRYSHADNDMTFRANNDVRMTIDSSGALLVHTSSRSGTSNFVVEADTSSENPMSVVNTRSSASTDYHIIMYRNGNIVGSVQTSLSATSFVTSSDYRLKENVTEITDATDRLKKLNPVKFNFISDADTTLDGFLAHEVQSIVPEAVTGTKDATEKYTDEEGKEQTRVVPQGIDQAKLVPLLVKTIQELEARITALESA